MPVGSAMLAFHDGDALFVSQDAASGKWRYTHTHVHEPCCHLLLSASQDVMERRCPVRGISFSEMFPDGIIERRNDRVIEKMTDGEIEIRIRALQSAILHNNRIFYETNIGQQEYADAAREELNRVNQAHVERIRQLRKKRGSQG